jgi:hypothetical protein
MFAVNLEMSTRKTNKKHMLFYRKLIDPTDINQLENVSINKVG